MQKLKPKWIVIDGAAAFEDGVVRQDGPKPGEIVQTPSEAASDNDIPGVKASDHSPPSALLRSDVMFEDGSISFEVWLDHPTNKVQFRLGAVNALVTFAGINFRGGAAYGIAHYDWAQRSQPLLAHDFSSPQTPPPTGRWVPYLITVQGSSVELLADGIRVARLETQITRAPLELVLRGYERTQVRSINVHLNRPQAFVVMQFTDEYNQLFHDVIQPVCEDFGFEVIRADNIYTNTLIIEDIARSIKEASLIIADITPNNPNVYYEVGFAHGIGKPAILLSDRKREKLPFDISGFRLLFYDNTIGGKSQVEAALRKHLTALRSY